MPLSTPSHKFLLDENVHRELYKFLKQNGYDVMLCPKSASDRQLAEISIAAMRIVITNDEDFWNFSKDEIFSIVWLRIAQGDSKALINSFEKLLKEFKKFSGRIVILEKNSWRDFPLMEEI